jgi:hypothetical protein
MFTAIPKNASLSATSFTTSTKKKKRKKEISLCWPRSQFEGEGTYMHKLAPNSQVNPETIDKFARAGLIKNL